jgi:two-component system response regulator MprA
MGKETIVVVDDDIKISNMLRRALIYEGYDVETVQSGEDALIRVLESPFDLIILDIMLPGINGWEICQEIRRIRPVPIIMLTAKDEVEDRVKGLDSGADDYIVKPFALEELFARIRVQLRRQRQATPSAKSLSFLDVTLHMESRECFRGTHQIDLKGKEFELLSFLMRHPRNVLSKEQILNQVWGMDYEGESNIIEVYVATLRSKLEVNGGKRVIHTVRGLGYVLKEGP